MLPKKYVTLYFNTCNVVTYAYYVVIFMLHYVVNVCNKLEQNIKSNVLLFIEINMKMYAFSIMQN